MASRLHELVQENEIDIIIAQNTNATPMTLLGVLRVSFPHFSARCGKSHRRNYRPGFHRLSAARSLAQDSSYGPRSRCDIGTAVSSGGDRHFALDQGLRYYPLRNTGIRLVPLRGDSQRHISVQPQQYLHASGVRSLAAVAGGDTGHAQDPPFRIQHPMVGPASGYLHRLLIIPFLPVPKTVRTA